MCMDVCVWGGGLIDRQTRERQSHPYPEGVDAQDAADEEPDERDPVELHLPPLPLAPLEDVADGDALNHRGGGGRLCVGVGRGDWPVTKLGKEASPRPSRIQTHTSMDACMYVGKDTHQVGRRARQVRGPHGVAAVLAGEPVLEAAAEAAEPDEPDGAIL